MQNMIERLKVITPYLSYLTVSQYMEYRSEKRSKEVPLLFAFSLSFWVWTIEAMKMGLVDHFMASYRVQNKQTSAAGIHQTLCFAQ